MLNYCVRNGNRWVHSGIVTRYTIGSIYPQPSTSSNHTSLSLVFLGCFGMGHITASISPFGSFHRCASKTKQKHRRLLPIILRFRSYSWEVLVWNTLAVQFRLTAHFTDVLPQDNILECFKLSPRLISTGPLHMSPRFHFQPIYLIVYKESYQITL